MPEIPQYQANKPIASLPGAVLDRERRPRMDNSGAINAVGRLADAARGTDISQHLNQLGPEAFGGQSARAAGAIAQGVQQIGNLLADVNERRMQAQNEIDYAEAQNELAAGVAEFENWKAEPKNAGNPQTWGTEWERRMPGVVGKLQQRPMSQMVRDRLAADVERWQGATSIRVATDATRETFAKNKNIKWANLQSVVQNGGSQAQLDEAALAYRQATGISAEETAVIHHELNQKRIGVIKESFSNRYNTAVLNKDLAQIDALLEQGKREGLYRDDEVDLMRTEANKRIDYHLQVDENKAQNEMRDGLLLKIAQGNIITPSEIDSLAAARKLDAGDAARLRESLSSQQGAGVMQFESLATRAMQYDPDDDPTLSNWGELQQQALDMGLNQVQAQRFSALLQGAAKQNSDARGKTTTAAKVWGRNQIEGIYKNLVTREDNLAEALKDNTKLEALGLTKTDRKQILALDGPEAQNAFRRAMSNKDRSIDPEKYNTLTDWTKQLFNDATSSAEGALDETDPEILRENAFQQARIIDQFDKWFDSQPTPPTAEDVKGKVKSITDGVLQGAATKSFFAPPASNASASANLPASAVSFRGFVEVPAESLEARLPAGLKPHAQTFIDAARENGLNPNVLAAISMHETANGTSSAFRNKRNAMGSSSSSGPMTFETVDASIRKQAKTLSGKIYGKAKSLDQLASIYAPIGASNDPGSRNKYWTKGVRHYYEILTDEP